MLYLPNPFREQVSFMQRSKGLQALSRNGKADSITASRVQEQEVWMPRDIDEPQESQA